MSDRLTVMRTLRSKIWGSDVRLVYSEMIGPSSKTTKDDVIRVAERFIEKEALGPAEEVEYEVFITREGQIEQELLKRFEKKR